MPLSSEEMDGILENYREILLSNKDLIAVDILHDENGENPKIFIRTRNPDALKAEGLRSQLPSLSGRGGDIPVEVVGSDPVVPELALDGEESLFDGMADVSKYLGMSGTKLSKPGAWGTLCLSGSSISVSIGSTACALNSSFILTNSHVAEAKGVAFTSFGSDIGKTDCVMDLDASPSLDCGIIAWTSNGRSAAHFRVFEEGSDTGKEIKGLRVPKVGDTVGKQGARTGWTTGRVSGKTITTLEGHAGTFSSWMADYGSAGGDSGSPILVKEGDDWHLVGIHFSSGPRFAGWDLVGSSAEGKIGITAKA